MGRRSVDPYSPRLGPHAGQAAARLDVFQRARTTDGRPADRMCARGSEAAHRSTPWPMCAAIAAITIEKFAALERFPIDLNREDSQEVTDERVFVHLILHGGHDDAEVLFWRLER